MTILYFTGTGNSLYVAKRIGGELLSIPQLMNNKVYVIEDDTVGIVYPCYGFNAPDIVTDYLSKVRIKSEYIFAVMTYGGDPFSGTKHMMKILSAANLPLDYVNEVLMPNNYLIGNRLTVQLTAEERLQMDTAITAIVTDIHEKKRQKLYKGFLSDCISAAIRGLVKVSGLTKNMDKDFTINDACTACGVCTNVCPVKNITIAEDRIPTFHNKCIFCTACINHCSQNAIHHNKEKSNLRYHNSNVKLSEIIESNNQLEKNK